MRVVRGWSARFFKAVSPLSIYNLSICVSE
jgi:hypothetical protein